ncbi:hypothetical protein [Undibacterium sp. TS12]|uniref:hypothetical protein n=1 Tax=Undibacterium sp. TS12 TaxID=2908202 RepID=UPI001F4C6B42|nr:hypothetical protein [Undibacterium sp. TS12]MCH8621112.1 hypothetical protein [Undibacterium sp. TS12]
MSLKNFLGVAMLLIGGTLSAQTLDTHIACTQTLQEDASGERLIYSDQARMQLHGTEITEFQWESSVFRSNRGHDCSIDTEDGLEAELTEKGWRIRLKNAQSARQKRGYDVDRGSQCSIRLEREGDALRIKPTCPALCGSRRNFSELTVNTRTGLCTYE